MNTAGASSPDPTISERLLTWWCRRLRHRPGEVPDTGALAAARSILILKLDAMGDFVLATPFLRALRHHAPAGCRIVLLTTPAAAELARACPHVDEVRIWRHDPRPKRLGMFRLALRGRRQVAPPSPSGAYDLAFIPRTGPDNQHARLLAYLSGAPVRIGFESGPAPVPPTAALTQALPYPPPESEAVANLRLLRALGLPEASTHLELWSTPEQDAALASVADQAGLALDRPFVVIGPGASLPHKSWPQPLFLRLARELVTRGLPVVVIGGPHDRKAFPEHEASLHNLAGMLSPNQSHALLRRARLFVGNDSGAMHLAAAAGCPVLLLSWEPAGGSGDVNAQTRFLPHGVEHRVLRPGDSAAKAGAAGISYERVAAALTEFLSPPGPAPRPPA